VEFATPTKFFYVYNYTDHLGNVRLSYTQNGNTVKTLEDNHYYPFGLKHENYASERFERVKETNGELFGIQPTERREWQYKYNGKEWQDELGLNLYDYGARNYDAAIGRWMNVDPLAEVSRRFSPYVYALNNPVFFIDPDGKSAEATYGVDKKGHITKLDDKKYYDNNGKEVDRLYKIADNGVKTTAYVEADKGTLNTTKAFSKGNGSYDYMYMGKSSKASAVYEFLAKNTEVEWGKLIENGNNKWIATSQTIGEEYGAAQLLFNFINEGKGLGYKWIHSHSHPKNGGIEGYSGPSGFDLRDIKYGGGDKAFITTLRKNYPNENIRTNVYDVKTKSYIRYAERGALPPQKTEH
jgi:RHS repeat-associated protein